MIVNCCNVHGRHQGLESMACVPQGRGFNHSFGYLSGATDHVDQSVPVCPSCKAAAATQVLMIFALNFTTMHDLDIPTLSMRAHISRILWAACLPHRRLALVASTSGAMVRRHTARTIPTTTTGAWQYNRPLITMHE